MKRFCVYAYEAFNGRSIQACGVHARRGRVEADLSGWLVPSFSRVAYQPLRCRQYKWLRLHRRCRLTHPLHR